MKTLALFLLCAGVAFAGPKVTHITGGVFTPIGTTPRTCTLTVQLTKPVVVGDTASTTVTHTIASSPRVIVLTSPSSVDFYLSPTTNATPDDAQYRATFKTSDGEFSQKWRVPPSAVDLRMDSLVVPE